VVGLLELVGVLIGEGGGHLRSQVVDHGDALELLLQLAGVQQLALHEAELSREPVDSDEQVEIAAAEVVVDASPLADRGDDRRVVVIGEDDARGLPRDISAELPHSDDNEVLWLTRHVGRGTEGAREVGVQPGKRAVHQCIGEAREVACRFS
jgi:hypothetical protein